VCMCVRRKSMGFLTLMLPWNPQREHFSSCLTKIRSFCFSLSLSIPLVSLHRRALALSEISRSDRMWKTKRKLLRAPEKEDFLCAMKCTGNKCIFTFCIVHKSGLVLRGLFVYLIVQKKTRLLFATENGSTGVCSVFFWQTPAYSVRVVWSWLVYWQRSQT